MIYELLDAIAWIVVIILGIGVISVVFGLILTNSEEPLKDKIRRLTEKDWFWRSVFIIILVMLGVIKINH